jgi:hypothetical protein
MFVSGQVIFFSMMNRGSAMGVRGLFVKFSGALVRIVRHDDPFWHKLSHVLVNFRVSMAGGCTVLNAVRRASVRESSANNVSGFLSRRLTSVTYIWSF